MTDFDNGSENLPAPLHSTALDDARHDISREDRNVHNHLMVTLTAQGFMIASLALLLTSGNPSEASKLEAIREYAPMALSIVGLTVGVAGFISVFAARRSLGKAIEKWNAKQIKSDARNRSDPYGGKLLHRMGGISAWTIASAFPVFWSVVMFAITSLQD